MNNIKKISHRHKTYDTFFVIVLLSLHLGAMFMGASKGFDNLEGNFPYKQALIRNYNRLKLKLGDRVFPTVLIGKDGWMDYTAGRNLDDIQNVNNFSNSFLRELGQAVNSCYQFAREKNFTFLIVIAPNKASIYPDKLPDGIEIIGDVSRFDQINAFLRTEGIPEFLDLRPALRNARTTHDVYYKTDTHWNGYGAYTAYHEIINSLSEHRPSLSPYPEDFFRIRQKPSEIQGLAKLIQADYILEPVIGLGKPFDGQIQLLDFHGQTQFTSIISDDKLPSLLMFHDSFGDLLKPFMSFNFSKGHYYYRAESNLTLNRDLISLHDPDIVIYEVVERNLERVPDELRGCIP